MGEVIVITSGKGGVGKTTTTANIGTGLAQMGKSVVLIDTDIGLRNLDVVMGLENRIVYNLVDVVEGKCRIKQALIKDTRHPSLYLMPSAQTKDKTSVTASFPLCSLFSSLISSSPTTKTLTSASKLHSSYFKAFVTHFSIRSLISSDISISS